MAERVSVMVEGKWVSILVGTPREPLTDDELRESQAIIEAAASPVCDRGGRCLTV